MTHESCRVEHAGYGGVRVDRQDKCYETPDQRSLALLPSHAQYVARRRAAYDEIATKRGSSKST